MSRRIMWVILGVVGAAVLLGICIAGSPAVSFPVIPQGDVRQVTKPSFRRDILPIFSQYCLKCHGEGGQGTIQSGLRLDSYDGVMKGTKHGKIVIPYDSDSSNLVVLIEGRADPSIRMPYHAEPLSPNRIKNVRNWIDSGAPNN